MKHNVDDAGQVVKKINKQTSSKEKQLHLSDSYNQVNEGKHQDHDRHQQCSKQNKIKLEDANVCTKYNNCVKQYNKAKPFNIHEQKNGQQFQFPSQILGDEVPQQICIIPVNQYGGAPQIDFLVSQSNQNWKKQQFNNKKLQMLNKSEKQKRLQQLFNKSKQKLTKCPKQSLKVESRLPWGHSIYNENKKQDNGIIGKEKQNQKIKQDKQKQNKVQLKPINERIKQYKQKLKVKQNENNSFKKCSYIDEKYENLDIVKKKIQQNAERILEEKRKQKILQEERIKTIKSKMRAIQIESRKSLKKYKKKPLDPNIQFKIDIVSQKNTKRKKKMDSQNVILQSNQQQININKITINNEHRKNNKIRTKNKDQNKKSKSSQKIFKKSQETQHIQTQVQDEMKEKNGKFYIWNIPIYADDYKVIDIGLENTKFSISSKAQKTFRQQVDEFLQTRMTSKMKKQISTSRQAKFEQLVQQKKKQYLKQFELQQVRGGRGMEQAFWCEDELYKLHPISNI